MVCNQQNNNRSCFPTNRPRILLLLPTILPDIHNQSSNYWMKLSKYYQRRKNKRKARCRN
jgi:hypothetical protein